MHWLVELVKCLVTGLGFYMHACNYLVTYTCFPTCMLYTCSVMSTCICTCYVHVTGGTHRHRWEHERQLTVTDGC